MIRLLAIACLVLYFTSCAHGAKKTSSQSDDVKNIKSFAGCYKVEFNFAETFPLAKDYKAKKPYKTGATELIVVDKESDGRVELQHILVINRGKDPEALKHWRQEWLYQPKEMLSFKGNNRWEAEKLVDSKGMWLQRVTQVDDAPRYECVAPWLNNGESNYWECRSWTPLPRREYTTRSDYQVLKRLNRQRLTGYGWVHEQDGEKLQVDDKGNVTQTLVEERGENIYTRIDESNCKLAQDWWNDRKDNWQAIRGSWEEVRKQDQVKLNFKDPEGDLWKKLFALDDKAAAEKWATDKVASESKTLIESYLILN